MPLSREARKAVDQYLREAIRDAEVGVEFHVATEWRHETAEELQRILQAWRAERTEPRTRLTLSGVVIGPGRTVQISGHGAVDGRYQVVKRTIDGCVVEREDEVKG